MRAAVLYGTVGAVVLSGLGAAPAEGDMTRTAADAVAVAAERAADEGIRFGKCPAAEGLPTTVRCGTVKVPLDYARPDGRQISLTVSRIEARGKDAKGRKVARQGALVFNPGGPGASGMFFPMIGHLPDWKRIAAAYDLVGYAPRGVGRSATAVLPGPEAPAPGARTGADAPLGVVQEGTRRACQGVRARLRAAERERAAALPLPQQRP